MSKYGAANDQQNYGKVVLNRRKKFVEEASKVCKLSKSQIRKSALEADKRYKNSHFDYFKALGKLYNDCFSVLKSSKLTDEKLNDVYESIITKDGPLAQAISQMHSDGTNVAVELSRSNVSRCFQLLLKNKHSKSIEFIRRLLPLTILQLGANASGHHLIIKYADSIRSSQSSLQEFIDLIYNNSRLFFCKYGNRIYDHTASFKSNSNKLLRQFVYNIFFAKLFESEIPDASKLSIEECLSKMSPELKVTSINRFFEFVEKIVTKELVNSSISLKYLLICCSHNDFLSTDEMQRLAEILFEASLSMLKYDQAVEILTYLIPYWSNKQFKMFFNNFEVANKINEFSIYQFIDNDVNLTFFIRLCQALDDTKLGILRVVKPLFTDVKFDLTKNVATFLYSLISLSLLKQSVNSHIYKLCTQNLRNKKDRDTIENEYCKFILDFSSEPHNTLLLEKLNSPDYNIIKHCEEKVNKSE